MTKTFFAFANISKMNLRLLYIKKPCRLISDVYSPNITGYENRSGTVNSNTVNSKLPFNSKLFLNNLVAS